MRKPLDLSTSHRKYRGRSLCETRPPSCDQLNPLVGNSVRQMTQFLQPINDTNGRRERRNSINYKRIQKNINQSVHLA